MRAQLDKNHCTSLAGEEAEAQRMDVTQLVVQQGCQLA